MLTATSEKYRIRYGGQRPYDADTVMGAVDCAMADIAGDNPSAELWIGNRELPCTKKDAADCLEQIGAVCIRAFVSDTEVDSIQIERVELDSIEQDDAPTPDEIQHALTYSLPKLTPDLVAAPAAIPEPPITPVAEIPYAPYGGNSSSLRDKSSFAAQLRAETCGVRLTRKAFFNRRSLDKAQVEQAAEVFHADSKQLSASRKLLDQTRAEYATVLKIMREARKYWGVSSVDYPVQGIRLIRKSLVAPFNERMNQFVADLNAALEKLEAAYEEMRADSEASMGDLFDPEDYPESIKGFFQIAWDFPSVEPPNHLKELHPEIYEQQQALVAARFEEAVRLQEEAFAEELRKLVAHLVERLTGTTEDGKPVQLTKNAVENVREFFGRFQETAIHSSPELDELILHAQKALEGVDTAELRKDQAKRQGVAQDMSAAITALDGMLVARPGRAISLEDE